MRDVNVSQCVDKEVLGCKVYVTRNRSMLQRKKIKDCVLSVLQALWRNRYQVWQRLEENGQIAMKVTPSQIEFTLPSPKLGIESIPVIDPPWTPKAKTKISSTIQAKSSQQVSFDFRFKDNADHLHRKV